MQVKLKKDLGLIEVFCIASGAMISSGLFVLPGMAFAHSGPAVIFSYLLAAVLALPAMFSMAELATAMPKAGGTYFFLDRSFGPAFGTMGGMANWFSISLKSAFALIGIGLFAVLIKPGIDDLTVKLIAVACCILFVLVNMRGVRHAGRTQIVLVLVLISALILYVAFGLPHVGSARFIPLVPYGTVSIIGTAGFVFISYGGLTKVASVAEEVKNPGRNIPLGMGLSLVAVTILYVSVIFVTVGVLDGGRMASSLTPVSTGADAIMGLPGMVILSLAAMLAFITTANAGIMTASRAPMAMSRDGLLPGILGRVSRRFKTPHLSIIFTGAFMVMAILFLNLESLVKTASTLMMLLFMFVNLSVIIMREAKIPNYQPKFKTPLYPWVQIAGMVGCFFLIVEMGVVPLFITGLFLTASFIWYWIYARLKVERESALICLIQRVANRNLPCEDIGVELREILRERDEVVEDRFDKLAHRCVILDISERISMEECFKKISGVLAPRLGLEPASIERMLMEREGESSTALHPGLAIPHIIVEGSNVFELALVKCRGGVAFPGVPQPVHALFVLVGTRDERNFHLRALMAIAQIAQSEDFLKKWMEARGVQELRDLILLGQRKRESKEGGQ